MLSAHVYLENLQEGDRVVVHDEQSSTLPIPYKDEQQAKYSKNSTLMGEALSQGRC